MIEEGDAVEYCKNMQEKEEENEGARLNQRQSQDKKEKEKERDGGGLESVEGDSKSEDKIRKNMKLLPPSDRCIVAPTREATRYIVHVQHLRSYIHTCVRMYRIMKVL